MVSLEWLWFVLQTIPTMFRTCVIVKVRRTSDYFRLAFSMPKPLRMLHPVTGLELSFLRIACSKHLQRHVGSAFSIISYIRGSGIRKIAYYALCGQHNDCCMPWHVTLCQFPAHVPQALSVRLSRAVRASFTCCACVFHVLCVGRKHLLAHSEGIVALLGDDY